MRMMIVRINNYLPVILYWDALMITMDGSMS